MVLGSKRKGGSEHFGLRKLLEEKRKIVTHKQRLKHYKFKKKKKQNKKTTINNPTFTPPKLSLLAGIHCPTAL